MGIRGFVICCWRFLAQQPTTHVLVADPGRPNGFVVAVVAAPMRHPPGSRCHSSSSGSDSRCHRRCRLSYCVSPHDMKVGECRKWDDEMDERFLRGSVNKNTDAPVRLAIV